MTINGRLTQTFTDETADKIIKCADKAEARDIIARISHIAYCKGVRVGRNVPLQRALTDMRRPEKWTEYFIHISQKTDASDTYRQTVIEWVRRIQQDALGPELNNIEQREGGE